MLCRIGALDLIEVQKELFFKGYFFWFWFGVFWGGGVRGDIVLCFFPFFISTFSDALSDEADLATIRLDPHNLINASINCFLK